MSQVDDDESFEKLASGRQKSSTISGSGSCLQRLRTTSLAFSLAGEGVAVTPRLQLLADVDDNVETDLGKNGLVDRVATAPHCVVIASHSHFRSTSHLTILCTTYYRIVFGVLYDA